LLAVISAIIQIHSNRPSVPPTPARDNTGVLRRRATQQLVNTTDWADKIGVGQLCEQADFAALPTTAKSHCIDAHLALVREHLSAGKIPEARKAFNLAVREGVDPTARSGIEQSLNKAEERAARVKREAEAVAADLARQSYAKTLRERYLDQNMDIKVEASGKLHDRLTLHFVLFNDVWAHKFQKGDLVEEIRRLGFRRVYMTDGYDYHVYWELK